MKSLARISHVFTLILGLFLTISLYSCGGGTTSSTTPTSSSYTISGEIVSTQSSALGTTATGVSYLKATAQYPYTIIAMSKDGNEVAEFNVESDGSFSIDTSNLDNNTVLFLKDNSNGEIIGNIKIKTLNNNYCLDHININDLVNNLDLGTINADNSSLIAQNSIETSGAFNQNDFDNLTIEGASDNGMCLYQNNLRNSYTISSYISVRFEDNITISNCENTYCTIDTSKTKFQGISPLFYIGSDNSSYLDNVTLNTPEAIPVGCKVMEQGMSQWCGDSYNLDNYTKTSKFISTAQYASDYKIYTIEMPYMESIPTGKWTLISNKDNRTIGQFTFDYSYPYDNDTFLGLTPALKFSVDDNNTINKVYVKFYGVDNKILDEDMVFNLLNTSKGDKGFNFSWVPDNSTESKNFILTNITDNGTVFEFTPQSSYPAIDNISRFIFGYHIGDEKFQLFITPSTGTVSVW